MGKMDIKLNEHQKNLILNYGVLTGLFFAWIVVVILFWNISTIVYVSSVGLGIIWFLVIRSIFYKDGVGLKYFIGNSKENKEKDKKKRDSLKKVLTFEKEYVKKMGESGIASYDEQQKRDEANRKKITKFGFIMLIVSFLWLSIGTMIMAYKFGNQDIVTYIKKYTVYNDAQFPAVPMEFNEEQLKSIVGLAKSKADYEKGGEVQRLDLIKGSEGESYYRNPDRGAAVQACPTPVWSQLAWHQFHPTETVRELKVPYLVIAGEKAFTTEGAKKMFENAPNPKYFHLTLGATHFEMYDMEKYVKENVNELLTFFGKHL